jgi:hypothetical protein
MNSDQLPEDGITHPLFISPIPYIYRVTYRTSRKADHAITYTSPHEIILNLHCFKNRDRITYLDRSTNEEIFTISVDRFKYRIAETIYQATNEELDTVYLRLILTNNYSKLIPDRGRFRGYDQILRQFMLTIKGGYDIFLTTDHLRTILYSKIRRTSNIHLLSTIEHWNNENDIHMNHINLPKTMANQPLVYECLRVALSKQGFRLYQYDPQPEDNMFITSVNSEIIQVINQLIQ